MTSLIDQVLFLLESDSGSLIYHLILTFSVAGALLILFYQNQQLSSQQNRRISNGLMALLILQIIQFALSGLTWPAIFSDKIWLPLLDRFSSLLSLLMIVWLWAFPNPRKVADRLFTIACVALLAAALITVLWWNNLNLEFLISLSPGNIQRINGSPADRLFQVFSLVTLLLGLITLSRKHPAGWGYGFVMFLLLAVGHIAHLLQLPYGINYPTFLRLFHIAAYPFILLLPLRSTSEHLEGLPSIPEREIETPPVILSSEAPAPQPPLIGIEPWTITALLRLLEHYSDSQSYQQIASILAEAADADFVSLFSPSDSEGLNHVLSGYDRASKQMVDEILLESRSLPILNSCLKTGRTRSLPATSSSPDRQILAGSFGLELLGPMLFVPVISSSGDPMVGVILSTSAEEKDWSDKQQDAIGMLTSYLIHNLSLSQEITRLRWELDRSRDVASILQGQAQQAFAEQQKLSDTLTVIEEDADLEQGEVLMMSAQLKEQKRLESMVEELRLKNQQLEEALLQALEKVETGHDALEQDSISKEE